MKKIAVLLTALAVGLLMLAGQAGAQSTQGVSGELVVDDDDVQCPEATFTTIQAAVDAASEGDTIRVCPGTYNEAVNVNKTLNLVADDPPDPASRAQSGPGDPLTEAIVDPPSAQQSGFTVQANDVIIDGFTVKGGDNAPGIATNGGNFGHQIMQNLIRDNTFGLYFNSNGETKSIAAGNVFTNNIVPGAASGNGIYSDQGLSNADMQDNSFTGHTNASLIFVGNEGTQSDLLIAANTITDDASLLLANVTDSTVTENESQGSNGSGIFLGGGVENTEISNNDLRNGAFTGINVRFLPDVFNSTEPNSNNTISDNTVRRFGDGGIRLRDNSQNNTVEDNEVRKNGLSTEPESGGQNGISLEDDASDNTIRRNTALKNEEFDCRDRTSGSGTAGTANTWKGNTGETDKPKGLCKPKKD